MASEIQLPSRCHPVHNPRLEYWHLHWTLLLLQHPYLRKQQPTSGGGSSALLLLSKVWILQQEQCPMQMPILSMKVVHWTASGLLLHFRCHRLPSEYINRQTLKRRALPGPYTRGGASTPEPGPYTTGIPILRPASGHFMISRPTQQLPNRFPAYPTLKARRFLI